MAKARPTGADLRASIDPSGRPYPADMGVIFPEPALEVGESIVWRALANRTQGGRAVGGRLYLTSRRICFSAHRLDRLFGGQDWESARDQITWVGLEPSSLDSGPFSGGLRTRLRLDVADGDVELFVVNRLVETPGFLRHELGLDADAGPSRSDDVVRSQSRGAVARALPWPYWLAALGISLWFLAGSASSAASAGGGRRWSLIVGAVVGLVAAAACALQLVWLIRGRTARRSD